MVKLRFEPAGYETEADVGARLVDVTDEHPKADVPYSCRAANCGTCRVEVVLGEDALEPPEDDELETLQVFGDEPKVRLCCQLRLSKSAKEGERVLLRVVEPRP